MEQTADATSVKTLLRDSSSARVQHVSISLANDGTSIAMGFAKGPCIGCVEYGEKTAALGYGTPVLLELYRGKLTLHVWSDINSEGPTHSISLEGAREDARVQRSV